MNLKFRVWNRDLKRYEEFASLLTETAEDGSLQIIGILDSDGDEQLVDYDPNYDEGVDIEFCTGFTDKSGTDEIYEGDMLLTKYGKILKVYFCEETSQFTTDTSWLWGIAKVSEIIGNVHENPELLGGEGE